MRIFLGVFPPPAVQETAAHVAALLRARSSGVAWVKRENLHLTLRFLGETDEHGVRRAGEAAQEAARAHAAFEAELGVAGAFPSPRRARVIWIGLARGGPQLVALAETLDAALERRGVAAESRGFSPHLTIGRVRVPGADWTLAVAGAAPPAESERTFAVSRLLVVESRLHPRGSLYRVVEEAPLGAH